MRFRLRSLVLATAIVPPLLGYGAMSLFQSPDATRFEWPDPILTLGAMCWVGMCIYVATRLPSSPG